MPSRVVLTDLRKRYGPIEAVRGVSLDIHDGEVFGLIGPNGAGKTTTIECLIGLREPDAGSIQICGLDAQRERAAVHERIGAALQTTSLQDKITPREALNLFGALYSRRIDTQTLLSRFALEAKADASFDALSGGQRQRLALALAFVNDPELILLDEPTAGLDPQARRELHAQILDMGRDGRTVLLTTHDMDEAQALCDRIAIIDRGHVIATGAPAELIARSAAAQSISFVASGAIDRRALESLPGVDVIEAVDGRTRLTTSQAPATLAALGALLHTADLDIVELHVQRASLEDVFIELTGEAARD